MSAPAFLFVELSSEHADQIGILRRLGGIVREGGGEVIASAPAGRVACLEPGTVGAGILIARWAAARALTKHAQAAVLPLLRSALPGGAEPLVLRVDGLPLEGLPAMMEIPTAASVPRPPRSPRNALLVIRGSASNPEQINSYRDVILPMHKERGGFYEVFALQPGEAEALSGRWIEQIFAISRWPRRELAEDFWYCDRYQTFAIPKRLGAGSFSVQLIEAAEDV